MINSGIARSDSCRCWWILRENVREGDVACRFGGDEFCVLLPHADRARGIEVASRIDRAVRTFPFRVRQETVPNHDDRQTVSLAVSIGVAAFPEAALTRAGLLEQADRACYRAKALEGGVIAEAGLKTLSGAEDNRSSRLHLFKGARPPARLDLKMCP
jgi:GGDEF domain-containing protein